MPFIPQGVEGLELGVHAAGKPEMETDATGKAEKMAVNEDGFVHLSYCVCTSPPGECGEVGELSPGALGRNHTSPR